MVGKLVKPEEIRNMDWGSIPLILGKLSLYNLNYLYNYYKETLDLSSKTIKSVYVDKTPFTPRELEEHRVMVSKKCMYNIKLAELMIFWIEKECDIRNIEKRFFA